MPGRLLDANVLIDAFQGKAGVRSKLETARWNNCYLSTIAYHELWFGIEKSLFKDRNEERLSLALEGVEVLAFSPEDGRAAAWVRADLGRRKQLIGQYDTLIAGQAIARGLTMVTANEREFRRVSGLRVENWRSAKP